MTAKDSAVRRAIRPYRGRLAIAAASAVLATAALLVPYWVVVQVTYGYIVDSDATTPLPKLALIALLAILGHYVLLGCAAWLSHVTAYRILADLRLGATAKLGRLPLGRVSGRRSGELKTVLIDDVERLEIFLAHGLPDAVSAAVVWSSLTVWMFVIDWRLALAAIVVVPIAFYAMSLAMKDNAGYAGKYAAATARMNSSITETITAMPVVHSFIRPDRPLHEARQAIAEQAEVSADLGAGFFARASAFYVLIAANGVTVVPLAGWLVSAGLASVYDVVFFVIVALGSNSSIVSLFLMVGQGIQLLRSRRTVDELMAEPELVDASAPVELADVTVRFDRVSFSYDDERLALREVTFEARPGEITAVVGPSGAGKSTIARLLSRAWDTDGITIGGIPIRDIPMSQLAKTVTVVDQDPFLFSGSIADNIRMGRPDATDEHVRSAAQAAQVLSFAERLPDGLNTEVGERGSRLSGGQLQRVSIARTLLADTPVLVLDEATAYADPDNEFAITQALAALTRGRTLIVIAHRLSTTVGADQIVVLDDGAVVATGRHDALLAEGGVYRGLWQDWQGLESTEAAAQVVP